MPGLRLSDLRTQVRNALNEPTASFWSDAEINSHLLNAYHQVMQMLQVVKTATGTIAQGQTALSVPADWAETLTLLINNQPVALTTPRELGLAGLVFTDPDAAKNDQGQPYAYFTSGVDSSGNPAWTLYPVPDKSYPYTLYYVAQDAGLPTDASVPLFRSDWHHILTYYAIGHCWAKNGRYPEMAAFYLELWDRAKVDAEFYLVDARAANYVTRFVDGRVPAYRNVTNDPLEIPGL